jgi:hypothetical protein
MNDITLSTKPPISLRLLAALTALLTLAAFLIHLWLIEPLNPAIKPKGLAAVPFAVLFAFGMSVAISLAVANRHRWHAVLRPSQGRIIGALVLLVVTPTAVFTWAPSILGFWIVLWLSFLVDQRNWDEVAGFLALAVLVMTVWYPIAALIVSGIGNRLARVALFCLMFWTAYSAVILAFGTRTFML